MQIPCMEKFVPTYKYIPERNHIISALHMEKLVVPTLNPMNSLQIISSWWHSSDTVWHLSSYRYCSNELPKIDSWQKLKGLGLNNIRYTICQEEKLWTSLNNLGTTAQFLKLFVLAVVTASFTSLTKKPCSNLVFFHYVHLAHVGWKLCFWRQPRMNPHHIALLARLLWPHKITLSQPGL